MKKFTETHYPLSRLTDLLNWMTHTRGHEFLESVGITPAQTFKTGKVTWRLYDKDAYEKVREMRRERDALRKAQRQQQSSPPVAAPVTVAKEKPVAVPVPVSVAVPLSELRADVRSLHSKIDLLLRELGAMPSFDVPKAPQANGHAEVQQ